MRIRHVRRHWLPLAVLLGISMPMTAARGQRATSPSACVDATGPDVARGTPAGPQRTIADTGRAALRLLASVTADEVRFAGSPRVCVRLTGDARLDSLHVLGRRNLASPVVSGTTYHDIYIAVEIVGRLNAGCIAARITGTPPDSSAAAACASPDATRVPAVEAKSP